MNRLRNKLIVMFLAATLVPLAAILWISMALLETSLSWVTTDDLDRLSKSLEATAREYYRQARDDLKAEVASGRLEPQLYHAGARATWPVSIQQFWESPDVERFELSEPAGGRLNYVVRHGTDVWLYSRSLNGIRMDDVTRQISQTHSRVEKLRQSNLHRGLIYPLILLTTIIWILSLASVIYLANRVSRPIQDLTAGLFRLAGGHFETRLHTKQ